MSQIRCFLVLFSIILGLACIVECRSTSFSSRYDPPAKENKADKNSPRQHESCYYPYRSSTPERCDYSILFGNYSEGDELIWNEKYSKLPCTSSPLVVEAEFKSTNGYRISYMYLENSKQSKRIWDDDVGIHKGGIGKEYVGITIKSSYCYPSGYRLAIYGRRSKTNRID